MGFARTELALQALTNPYRTPTVLYDLRASIGSIERATILVIDDDAEMIGMLAEYLEPEGFDVEPRYDGDSGLKKAMQNDCAIVVLGVMLPRLNGFEVLRRLRAAGSKIPVLMLTTRGDAVDRIVGLQTGADDYLPKPFDHQSSTTRPMSRRSRCRLPALGRHYSLCRPQARDRRPP